MNDKETRFQCGRRRQRRIEIGIYGQQRLGFAVVPEAPLFLLPYAAGVAAGIAVGAGVAERAGRML